MSKGLFFSLVLLLATFLSAYAEEPAQGEAENKFSLGAGTSYGRAAYYGTHFDRGSTPGVNASLGYALSRRSSLVLGLDRQHFNDQYGSDHYSTTYTSLLLGYKYWLNDSETWRPFVQASAGYSWIHTVASFGGDASVFNYNDTRGKFAMQVGGGVRYSLFKQIGLDASAMLNKFGNPVGWTRNEKILTGSFGADVTF